MALAQACVKTLRQLRLPGLTVLFIVGLAYLYNYSGMAYTLGAAVAGVGAIFPLVSSYLGWVACFLSGSDTAGTENLRRILTDWLEDMALIPAGHMSHVDRYVGYYEPYATSHDDLDKDEGLQEDVRNAARALMQAVKDRRSGKLEPPDRGLKDPEPK